MLQSKGVKRTFKHNLLLAILFAFTAGIVNVYGFVNLGVFTTNITGHVGEFALWFELSRWTAVKKIALWLTVFGLGSFCSSLCVGFFKKRQPKLSYALPILVEIALLLWCFLIHNHEGQQDNQVLILLFAMGLQNGIVSVVSGNVVRTTHLTGMVTDIGIGLGKMFLKKGNKVDVRSLLLLNSAVVLSFLIGGVLGAYITLDYYEKALLIPIFLLISILIYDFKMITTAMEKMREFKERLQQF